MTEVGLRPPSVMDPATRLSHLDCRATSILIVALQEFMAGVITMMAVEAQILRPGTVPVSGVVGTAR